jgi:acyl-CoA thioesterase YciA
MHHDERSPAIRVMMFPRDTNPAGTIFGGVILSYIDQAGAEEAKLHGADAVVTVAMKEVIFSEPVYVGDLVSFYTELVRTGRTSVTVRVSVEAARHPDRRDVVRVTQAEITYVNVDGDRRPRPLRQPASGGSGDTR